MLDMSKRVQPTQKRIVALDVMRGFALCGIIFANLVSFTGFYSLSLPQIQALPSLDRAILFAIDFLIEGKFYSVFATLLGAGFALQYTRFKQRNQAFSPFWLRRMQVLFVLGICHMYLIWHGDILTLYSLLGICLLLFIQMSNKKLLICIGLCLTLPLIMHAILASSHEHYFWQSLNNLVLDLRQALGYQDVSLLMLRTASDANDIFWGNVISAIPRPMSYLKTGRPFQVFGQFLLGIYLVRIYLQGNTPIPSRKVVVTLLLSGSVLNLVYAYIKFNTGSPFTVDALGLLQGLVYHLGCTLMALGYMGLLYRLWNRGFRFLALAQLGRMALSMYLMQTSICVLLFYGYGFAWMGQVQFYSIILFGIAILAIQFIFSRLWLAKFQLGPMEYLWRRLGHIHK